MKKILFYAMTLAFCFNPYIQSQVKKTPFFSDLSDYPDQFQFALNTGYSKQIFPGLFYKSYNTPQSHQDFVKNISNGFYNEIDFSYYFKRFKTIGIGIKYSKSFCRASATDISYDAENIPVIGGNLEQSMNYGFFGPQFSVRVLFLKNNMFYSKIAFGSVYFNQHTISSNNLLNRDFTIKSNTFGLNFEFAYDYFISKHLAVGIHGSFTAGAFFDYTLYENSIKSYQQFGDENELLISPLDIGVGLRYNF